MTQDTFGTFLWLTDVPTSGNSPHHLGSSKDGQTLVGGGLLSLLKTQVWNRLWIDISSLLTGPRTLLFTLTYPIRTGQPSRRAIVLYYPQSQMKSVPNRMGKSHSPMHVTVY